MSHEYDKTKPTLPFTDLYLVFLESGIKQLLVWFEFSSSEMDASGAQQHDLSDAFMGGQTGDLHDNVAPAVRIHALEEQYRLLKAQFDQQQLSFAKTVTERVIWPSIAG